MQSCRFIAAWNGFKFVLECNDCTERVFKVHHKVNYTNGQDLRKSKAKKHV